MTFFDWRSFFGDICVHLAALSNNNDTRTSLLKDVAHAVFLPSDAFLKYDAADPLSFLYNVARYNGRNNTEWNAFAERARRTFRMEAPTPTDRYFPTPPAFKIFYFTDQSEYRTNAGALEDPALPWDFLLALMADNRAAELPALFRRVLDLKNVGVAKLTQTMFLIRPDLYLPLDKATRLPFGAPNESEVMQRGWAAYAEFLSAFKTAMPGCAPYDANLLGYLLRSKAEGVELRPNWFQVSSKVDGGSAPHQFEEFVEAGAVWTGAGATDKGKEYALKVPQRGDLMLVRNGLKNLGAIGMVWENGYADTGYTPDAAIQILWLAREPRYINDSLGDWRAFSRATPTTIEAFAAAYPETVNMVNALLGSPVASTQPGVGTEDATINSPVPKSNMPSVNTILYGPPGTGKTFSSIAHALAIIEGKSLKEINAGKRDEIKARFDELLIRDWDNPKGQIGFITFHQSLSYEDFIEGIKPISPDDDDEVEVELRYAIKDGIFKQLCTEAAFESVPTKGGGGRTNEALAFDEEYDALVARAEAALEVGKPLEISSFSKMRMQIDEVSSKGNLRVKHEDGTRNYGVSKARLGKIAKAYPDLSEVRNIYNDFRAVIGGSNASAYWAVLNEIRTHPAQKEMAAAQPRVYDQKQKKEAIALLTSDDFRASGKPYILIIDEINRGNVSQIFGELITLIEDGKRTGQSEALSVTLPYSRENFSVPPNLYLIGTMNTADRSVEALDTALRRRFSFVEMSPEETHTLIPTAVTIGGRAFNFQAILATINRRLEKLAGRDHKIGHSYFIPKEDTPPWQYFLQAFTDKIIPLLQEYFYADWGRMCLVLGQGFVTLEQGKTDNLFATLPKNERATADALPDLREREVWLLADFKNRADAEALFATALDTLMGRTLPAQTADDTAPESDGDE